MSKQCVYFFQAEDGIRDIGVTGVQTCALPILWTCDRWDGCGQALDTPDDDTRISRRFLPSTPGGWSLCRSEVGYGGRRRAVPRCLHMSTRLCPPTCPQVVQKRAHTGVGLVRPHFLTSSSAP